MTTPNERARAIRWGRADLVKIQDDALLTDEIRQQAADILESYPDESQLQSWIGKPTFSMSKQTADSLNAARQLFEQVRLADTCNAAPELRNSLLYTLRHFPLANELDIRRQEGADLFFGRAWVE